MSYRDDALSNLTTETLSKENLVLVIFFNLSAYVMVIKCENILDSMTMTFFSFFF